MERQYSKPVLSRWGGTGGPGAAEGGTREGGFGKHISESICSGISSFEESRCGHGGGCTGVEQAGRRGWGGCLWMLEMVSGDILRFLWTDSSGGRQ